MSSINELATEPVGRLLWKYSLPSVVGMTVSSMYNVIDRVLIGQNVGHEAIAGLAITFPVMNLSTALGVLIGGGASARISMLLGAKRQDEAERTLGCALLLTTIIGTIYITCFAVWLEDILRAFGASDVTLPYAYAFMSVLLPGLLIMNFTFSFNNIQRSSGYPRRAMMTMVYSAIVNMFLAWLFIYPLDLGIAGAALATLLATSCAFVFVFRHFFRKTSVVHFRRGIFTLRWRTVWPILAIGSAPFTVNVAGCLVNVIINRSLMLYGGDEAVGAAGIFTTLTQLVVMIVLGICQGMQPIVGYNYGAGKLRRSIRAYWLAVCAATVLCVLASVVSIVFPATFARAFTNHPRLIEVTSTCLSTAMLAFAMVGFQIVSTNFFQSIGKAGESLVLSLARQVIFLIPLLLWLPTMFRLNGVWMSFPISDALATVVTAVMIFNQMRKLNDAERRLRTQ